MTFARLRASPQIRTPSASVKTDSHDHGGYSKRGGGGAAPSGGVGGADGAAGALACEYVAARNLRKTFVQTM